MKKHSMRLLTLVLCGTAIFPSCKKKTIEEPNSTKTEEMTSINKVAGYLYTTTNGEDINQVIKFSRHADGSLSDESAYSTNSKGGANISAGGDAHGDFDSQGAIQIIDKYLLAVNAGGNQISVFAIDNATGNLTFKSNVSSSGTRPVSIAFTKKAGKSNEYWVVAANQWNNPNVQKDGASIERYPNDNFHNQDLTLADASDNERNITLFSFNSETGALVLDKQLDKYVRENGGPTTVSFSDDGTKIAVSTWGIAHFSTMNTSLDEQHPSRVYVYDFSAGNVSGKRYFEEAGIAGTIGFNWAKSSNSKLLVSNFNLIPTKRDNSITVLTDNGTMVTKTSNSSATTTSAINEACWTALSPAGDKLYVASFATNLISTFSINGTGATLTSSTARTGLAPEGDSKEVYVTADNKFLYNTGAFKSFSINAFEIMGNTVNYKSQTFVAAASSGKGVAGKYNFLGLTGFDVK